MVKRIKLEVDSEGYPVLKLKNFESDDFKENILKRFIDLGLNNGIILSKSDEDDVEIKIEINRQNDIIKKEVE
ncbi:MAG: hypothetical protein ACOC33_02215 [bacterium]